MTEIWLSFLEERDIKRSALIQNFDYMEDTGAAQKLLLRNISLFQVAFLERDFSLFLCSRHLENVVWVDIRTCLFWDFSQTLLVLCLTSGRALKGGIAAVCGRAKAGCWRNRFLTHSINAVETVLSTPACSLLSWTMLGRLACCVCVRSPKAEE